MPTPSKTIATPTMASYPSVAASMTPSGANPINLLVDCVIPMTAKIRRIAGMNSFSFPLHFIAILPQYAWNMPVDKMTSREPAITSSGKMMSACLERPCMTKFGIFQTGTGSPSTA